MASAMLARMQADPAHRTLLSRITRTHHDMARRVMRMTDPHPAVVLELGAAVLFYGALEEYWLFELNPWLLPATMAQLQAEHADLSDDLALLQDMWETDRESSDVGPLAEALLNRLRQHIARDDRLQHWSARTRRPGSPPKIRTELR